MLLFRSIVFVRYLKFVVSGFALLLPNQIMANECLDLFPYDTLADGHSKICQSSFSGLSYRYSCQDYRSGDTRYRVLYRGGVTPKAVLQFNSDNSVQLLSAPLFGNGRLNCPLRPPEGVPEYAVHRGTGVCHDEDEQMVACSVFEHAAARQREATRYMIFFDVHKSRLTIDAQFASNNDDAMVAEFAFQIGMSLWDTECCVAQAVIYLEQAYQLFPQAEAYRSAFRRSRVILALKELS